MLRLSADAHAAIVAHALACLPEEACGLLVGPPPADPLDLDGSADAPQYHPCRNAAASAKVYTVDPRDHLRIDREAEAAGLQVLGVVHSHTHTDAYPSPTDVAQAPDPGWRYVICSLRHPEPSLRSYRIVGGEVDEEPITPLPG